jgi:hypothetical protein
MFCSSWAGCRSAAKYYLLGSITETMMILLNILLLLKRSQPKFREEMYYSGRR